MADILEGADEILLFDALVSTYANLERKMLALQNVMNRAGDTVKPMALQISDPFKQNGVAQVAAVFELSDGQTVSIFFHNPVVFDRKLDDIAIRIELGGLMDELDAEFNAAADHLPALLAKAERQAS